MSDYISKSALIEDIKRRPYIDKALEEIFFTIIDKQPAVDEKEIIRKTVERIVERLEYQEKQYESRAEKFAEALNSCEESRNRGKSHSYGYAIEIVKEECGINE